MSASRNVAATPDPEEERPELTSPPVERAFPEEDYWLVLPPSPEEGSYTLVTWLGETVAVFADGSYGVWTPASQAPTSAALRELVFREALEAAEHHGPVVREALAQAERASRKAYRLWARRRFCPVTFMRRHCVVKRWRVEEPV